MTKQEQIEEIKSVLISVYGRIRTISEDCINNRQAEALYNAGYHKIREKNETPEEQDDTKADIDRLNTIVENFDELIGKGIDECMLMMKKICRNIRRLENLRDKLWKLKKINELSKEYE